MLGFSAAPDQRVAIIGTGVAGLAVAYELLSRLEGAGRPLPEVHLFEKNDRIGGNNDTREVFLGEYTAADDQVHRLARKIDLGVCDFNRDRYDSILRVMNAIGFEERVDYRALEDSTSFFVPGRRQIYTLDGLANTQLPRELQRALELFMNCGARDAMSGDGSYRDHTIGRYLDEVLPKRLQEHMTPQPEDPARLAREVARYSVLPRVNGMYFVHDTGPETMPLVAVMTYYILQEGAGGHDRPYHIEPGVGPAPAKDARMYYTQGASSFTERIDAYLTRTYGRELIKRHMGTDAVVACHPSGREPRVGVRRHGRADWHGHDGRPFDAVVLACPADDALQCFQPGPEGYLPGPDPRVATVLSKLNYLNSIAIAHTFAGVLPVDRNAWRTYNISVNEPPALGLRPYTISYVVNRHQNDRKSPPYNAFGMPQFFLTINPSIPIPEEFVLFEPRGYGDDLEADRSKPAFAWLKHNSYDFDCLDAQRQLWHPDGPEPLQGLHGVYFTGGWTVGAGLQENCWQAGEELADLIAARLQLATAPALAEARPPFDRSGLGKVRLYDGPLDL